MFLLLTLNIFHTFSNVSVADFEQVNITWVLPSELRKGIQFFIVGFFQNISEAQLHSYRF